MSEGESWVTHAMTEDGVEVVASISQHGYCYGFDCRVDDLVMRYSLRAGPDDSRVMMIVGCYEHGDIMSRGLDGEDWEALCDKVEVVAEKFLRRFSRFSNIELM